MQSMFGGPLTRRIFLEQDVAYSIAKPGSRLVESFDQRVGP
jgi:hypothetical protein